MKLQEIKLILKKLKTVTINQMLKAVRKRRVLRWDLKVGRERVPAIEKVLSPGPVSLFFFNTLWTLICVTVSCIYVIRENRSDFDQSLLNASLRRLGCKKNRRVEAGAESPEPVLRRRTPSVALCGGLRDWEPDCGTRLPRSSGGGSRGRR